MISYRDIGDYLTRERKLAIVSESDLNDDGWLAVEPNEHGDWINQRSDQFVSMRPLAMLRGQPAGSNPVFHLASRGVTTSRDAWVVGSSSSKLTKRVEQAVRFYNSQVDALDAERRVDRDPKQFSWDGTIHQLLAKGVRLEVRPSGFRAATYRPFFRQRLYMDRDLNNSVYQLPQIFPTPTAANQTIMIESQLPVPGRANGILAVDAVPDVKAVSGAVGRAAVAFPRYVYDAAADK